jgi:hypothetical protein
MRTTVGSNTPLQDGLATLEATLAYGVSRQTLLQRVKRGELQAVPSAADAERVCASSPQNPQDGLFDHNPRGASREHSSLTRTVDVVGALATLKRQN